MCNVVLASDLKNLLLFFYKTYFLELISLVVSLYVMLTIDTNNLSNFVITREYIFFLKYAAEFS